MKKTDQQACLTPTYGRVLFGEDIPKNEIPVNSHQPHAVYRFIRDELQLDGNPTLNMASFVTTVMDDEANRLISENLGKNYIDSEVYHRTLDIQQRCVQMMLDLYKAPGKMKTAEELHEDRSGPWGTLAIGSSEALMLCALSHKRQWQKKQSKAGKDTSNPNIVLGSDVHITWVKYAKYFDLEIRWIPIQPENNFTITADEVAEKVDDNTTCVVSVMGTSYTGQNDPVESINNKLVQIKQDKNLDIPLHVDGASGGFIEPFRQYDRIPQLKWDFELEQVKSINVSGHKFGLVYPGVGWALWRDIKDIPEDLFISTNVLGFDETTYSLNFSRGSAMVLAQYYNFLRLGKEGYQSVIQNLMKVARHLANGLSAIRVTVKEKVTEDDPGKAIIDNHPVFEMVNNANYFPAAAVRMNFGDKNQSDNDSEKYIYNVHDIAAKLKQNGWIVPAFSMPLEEYPPLHKYDDALAQYDGPVINVMRMVVKESFSWEMADILIEHYVNSIKTLEEETRALKYPEKIFEVSVTLQERDLRADDQELLHSHQRLSDLANKMMLSANKLKREKELKAKKAPVAAK
ncbi:glutamate decarboxylase [Algicola sagamiensis]|uniref:glutamate decarboxylase n=1 Tax=Algicola sagamiensis TaxID=163869 RepID=UPI00035FF944|nr:glutamate decarboxylase [Algicola sagamiensis]